MIQSTGWLNCSLLFLVLATAPSGVIRTIAGSGDQGFVGDGGSAAEAKLNQPFDVAMLEHASDEHVHVLADHSREIGDALARAQTDLDRDHENARAAELLHGGLEADPRT